MSSVHLKPARLSEILYIVLYTIHHSDKTNTMFLLNYYVEK